MIYYVPFLFYLLVFLPKYLLGYQSGSVEIEKGERVVLLAGDLRLSFCVMLFGWDFEEIKKMAPKKEMIIIPFFYAGGRYNLFINKLTHKYGYDPQDISEDIIFDQIRIYPQQLLELVSPRS